MCVCVCVCVCVQVNGEAIYGSVPWRAQNDTSSTWYTASKVASITTASLQRGQCSSLQDGRSVYAISFMPPTPGQYTSGTVVELLEVMLCCPLFSRSGGGARGAKSDCQHHSDAAGSQGDAAVQLRTGGKGNQHQVPSHHLRHSQTCMDLQAQLRALGRHWTL